MNAWQSWQRVWRVGLAPQLSIRGLQALARALEIDDPRLLQGRPLLPVPFPGRQEKVLGACAVCLCGWQGDGIGRTGQLEQFFHRTCAAADEALGESAACRFFFNWFDDTPRAEMRRALAAEVHRSLQQRRLAA